MNDSEKLLQLKELLLNEDRDFALKILQKLDSLEETVYKQEKLSEKVNPIIDEKLHTFVDEIPDKLGPVIAEALMKSQDKVVEALFPVMGKMIKKYIQQEMKILSDNINSQLQNTFSFKNWKRKFKAMFTGVSEKEIILSEMNEAKIEQLFIIESGSGLLIASASNEENIDEDMIAGMLTAIKSFVEDAYQKEQQNLELIQYELFEIHLQNFTSYYFAVVISGGINNVFKSKLENNLFDFAAKHIKSNLENKIYINEKLQQFLKDNE
jgi:hypothetical protein